MRFLIYLFLWKLFNQDKDKIFSKINLNLIKLRIDNELSLGGKKTIGKSNFTLINLKELQNIK